MEWLSDITNILYWYIFCWQLCECMEWLSDLTSILYQYIFCLQLCECMEWLSDLTNISPDLTVSYLKDSLDGVLMEHYYTPVLQNLRKRKTLGHLHQVGMVMILNMSHLATNQQNGMCVQRRLGSAWASAQPDQSLHCPHEESLGP